MRTDNLDQGRAPKPARPGLASRRPPKKTVKVRLTGSELSLIQQHAEQEKETPSAFVRRATLAAIANPAAGPVREEPGRAEEREALLQIRRLLTDIMDRRRRGGDVDLLPVLRVLREWVDARVPRG